MEFVIEVERDDGMSLMQATLPAELSSFVQQTIVPALRPLSEDDYVAGPIVMLRTLARWSYVADGQRLYWCVEWGPGLIVVELSATAPMRWAALRSPVPEFGGREPTDEDLAAYRDGDEAPYYALIFTAWDAQLEADRRPHAGFRPVTPEVRSTYRRSLARADELAVRLERRLGEDREATREWTTRCKANLAEWAGEGVRRPT